ncbi:conserved hypothetical protein, partial [delta proteobacterium NaphS2]
MIIDKAVCRVDQYPIISLVQLSGFVPGFRLYKEKKFQIMSAVAAFNAGD